MVRLVSCVFMFRDAFEDAFEVIFWVLGKTNILNLSKLPQEYYLENYPKNIKNTSFLYLLEKLILIIGVRMHSLLRFFEPGHIFSHTMWCSKMRLLEPATDQFDWFLVAPPKLFFEAVLEQHCL